MSRRHGAFAVAAAAAMLVGVWRWLPAASPPLYDGVCIADPYRLLGSSPPPSSATKTFPPGEFPTSEVITDESPAQAQLLLMMDTFGTPATSVTVSITPVRLPAPPPSGWTLDGNAYRMVAVDPSGKMLQPNPQDPVTVVLRGTGATAALTMYVDDGSGWKPLKTFNAGCGYSFEAVSTTLGTFALFAQGSGQNGGGQPQQGGGFPVAALAGVLVVVIIVAVIGLARLSARGGTR